MINTIFADLVLTVLFCRHRAARAAQRGPVTLGPWSNGSAPTLIRVQNGILDGGADPRRSRYIFGR